MTSTCPSFVTSIDFIDYANRTDARDCMLRILIECNPRRDHLPFGHFQLLMVIFDRTRWRCRQLKTFSIINSDRNLYSWWWRIRKMMINGSKMLNRVVQMMDKVQSNLTTSYLLFRNNSALFSTCNQFKTDDVFQPELACVRHLHIRQ